MIREGSGTDTTSSKTVAEPSKKKLKMTKTSSASSSASSTLWSVKHRPRHPKELIGNNQNVVKLTQWLKMWSRKYGNASARTKKMTATQLKNFNAHRGVMLSGPPGIGKTSAASLVARHMGFEVLEFNASDKRSKKNMANLGEAVNSKVIRFGGGGGGGASNRTANTGRKGRVVIMDEVDGMSSGDRGGASALANVIRQSRAPVICICNDLQKKSLASLRSVCLGLPFRRPNKMSICKRMQAIAKKEGLLIEETAMGALVEGVGNDIRQVLNALQMMSRRGSSKTSIRYSDMKARLQAISKDSILRMTPFTGAQQIFNTRSATLRDRYEAFFVDYALMPLMVQENYANALNFSRDKDAGEKVDRLKDAADAIADADLLASTTGGTMNWGLLKYQAAANVEAAYIADGFVGQVQFPGWFGKFSKRNGRKRILREMSTHMSGGGASLSCGPNALRLDNYLGALRASLMRPLRDRGADGIDELIEALRAYGLSREDLMEKMPEFQLGVDPTAVKIPTKVKTAFTRAYNSGSGKVSQAVALTAEAGATKDKVTLYTKKKGKGAKKKKKRASKKKGK